MAKKVALAAALLMALLALARATTYTTTIVTTAVDDEANPGQQQRCQQQLQGRQFRSCQRYLSQRGGGGYADDEVLEESMGGAAHRTESLSQCCEQLMNVNEQCRCEAIQHAVRQMQQGGQTGQSQQVYQKARQLPRQCNMKPHQCQFRVVFV